ncbi:hypothetical protein [Rhizosaccharibacter radicis]|uniref:Uncharacterized protein n=1 Tax=Rhizosaccharibacter radicis TaxID=2782605 RepID=A0ABT1VT36_9PROT|nr:hypothetical protein [Acetobacteraceae bacterium KSS12]
MSGNNDGSAHDKARDLVETALEKLDEDRDAARGLIRKADRLDPGAADEVVADLDEDAGSDHSATAGPARG